MTNKPKARSQDWPPQIHVLGLPEGEHRAASQIQVQLHELASRGRDFAAVVSLFEYSMMLPALKRAAVPINPDMTSWTHHWSFIAARDGAMTIYHFGKAIELISSNFANCPTLLGMVDRQHLRTARRRMRELFPRFELVRHAVAHSAELMNEESTSRKHSIYGPYEIAPGIVVGAGTSVMLAGTIKDREFVWTIDKKLQSYEISKTTVEGIADVRVDIYSAFLPVESQTRAMVDARENPSDRTEST